MKDLFCCCSSLLSSQIYISFQFPTFPIFPLHPLLPGLDMHSMSRSEADWSKDRLTDVNAQHYKTKMGLTKAVGCSPHRRRDVAVSKAWMPDMDALTAAEKSFLEGRKMS